MNRPTPRGRAPRAATASVSAASQAARSACRRGRGDAIAPTGRCPPSRTVEGPTPGRSETTATTSSPGIAAASSSSACRRSPDPEARTTTRAGAGLQTCPSRGTSVVTRTRVRAQRDLLAAGAQTWAPGVSTILTDERSRPSGSGRCRSRHPGRPADHGHTAQVVGVRRLPGVSVVVRGRAGGCRSPTIWADRHAGPGTAWGPRHLGLTVVRAAAATAAPGPRSRPRHRRGCRPGPSSGLLGRPRCRRVSSGSGLAPGAAEVPAGVGPAGTADRDREDGDDAAGDGDPGELRAHGARGHRDRVERPRPEAARRRAGPRGQHHAGGRAATRTGRTRRARPPGARPDRPPDASPAPRGRRHPIAARRRAGSANASPAQVGGGPRGSSAASGTGGSSPA